VARDRLAAFGALLCALAVALAAYASHASAPGEGERLGMAAAFAFAHGLALLLPVGLSPPARLARLCWLLGVAGFCGGLVYAALSGGRAQTAPLGGSLMILGWLLLAFDRLRVSSESKQ
jgi:uncharacterized membrane protein YgdD (TMEM256/DUF423 family)